MAGGAKQDRYPEHHGVKVRTLALEPLGRLGDEGAELLAGLAADAAAFAGDRSIGPGLRRRWRHAIEFALVAGVADAVLAAAGRAGSVAWERGAAPKLGRVMRGPCPAGAGAAPPGAPPGLPAGSAARRRGARAADAMHGEADEGGRGTGIGDGDA